MIYWLARRDMRVFGLHKSLFDFLAKHRDSLALPPTGDGHWALAQLSYKVSLLGRHTRVPLLCLHQLVVDAPAGLGVCAAQWGLAPVCGSQRMPL